MSLSLLLNQSVDIQAKASANEVGDITFGTAVTYPARFEEADGVIMTAQKEREPIDGRVFVDSDCVVAIGDKLVYGGTDYKIMRVDKLVLGSGSIHHYELVVQECSM